MKPVFVALAAAAGVTATVLPAFADFLDKPIIVEVREASTGNLMPAQVRTVHHGGYVWTDDQTGPDGTVALDPAQCWRDANLHLTAIPEDITYDKGFRTCYDPQPIVIYVRPKS
ncbi:MAG: hypothetical protein QM699_16960 [Amaricoccus sp.]|uniref:hypothetical protein n=1 Tax=Amaricoccus sp. TaxID=1872485 RepID=UPI0039E47082